MKKWNLVIDVDKCFNSKPRRVLITRLICQVKRNYSPQSKPNRKSS